MKNNLKLKKKKKLYIPSIPILGYIFIICAQDISLYVN